MRWAGLLLPNAVTISTKHELESKNDDATLDRYMTIANGKNFDSLLDIVDLYLCPKVPNHLTI